jgi:hypothetical protein
MITLRNTRRIATMTLALAVIGAASIAGCGGDSKDSSTQSSDTACFVALASDFAPFKSWTSNHYDAPTDIAGNVHVAGPRTEYYNRAPDKGAKAFPVGTIIVKVIETTDTSAHHVFAMVKRGCGFNENGAKDWEWFELSDKNDILWRGVIPPSGDNYNGDPTGGCNSCHGNGCATNDSVCSPSAALHLSK